MSGNREQSKRRLRIAVLSLLSLLLVFVVVDEVGKRASLLTTDVLAVSADGLLGRGGADAATGFASSVLGEIGHEPPEGFKDEVLDPEGREVFVSDEGRVVGVIYPNALEEALGLVADELRFRGWKEVESGNPRMVSFVKKVGTYRWLFLSGEGDSKETCVTFLLSD